MPQRTNRDKPWKTAVDRLKADGGVHVYPVRDLRRHNLYGVTCWCDPKIEHFPNGKLLVTHHSLDGRELIEQHGIN
jgi:hypothetical protein